MQSPLKISSRRTLWLLSAVLVALVIAAVVIFATGGSGGSGAPGAPGAAGAAAARARDARVAGSGPATLTIGTAAVGRAIPPGFVGLTTEYRGLEAYAGTDPAALDPVFEQLIRNLAPGQSPVLRIGGDSTDWTWWPVPQMATPPGVKYTLTRGWLGVAHALAQTLDARLILGINFEADSGRVAAAEAQAMIRVIGSTRIAGLELGNEPELYGSFAWYKARDGRHVDGRPKPYDYPEFLQDFANIARSLPRGAPLAGPGTGSPVWIPLLAQFLAANPRVGLITLHKYPLKHCTTTPVTIPEVLSDASSTGLADSVASEAALAHRRGIPLRIDEMSAISCGGMLGVSGSFATALWSLDTMFAMARVGVDGVNVQTAPGSWNALFDVADVKGAWQADVHPAYYGLMMFAQAAPPGSRLLRVAGAPGALVSAWATRAPDGVVRVVLINDSTGGAPREIVVRVPSIGGPATLVRLQARSAAAQSGVTLGGQGFGPETGTGLLAGAPQATTVTPAAGEYVVSLPAASAALLTLPRP